MRLGARRTGALSALTVVSIMTALASGMASSTAAAAALSHVVQTKGARSLAQAQPIPAPCTGEIYESVGGAGAGTVLNLGTPGAGTITFAPVPPGTAYTNGYNAMGIHPTNRVLYAIDSTNNHLVSIDATTGAVTDLGATTLPTLTTGAYNIGGFDANGNFYVTVTGSATLYQIDLTGTTHTATGIPLHNAAGVSQSLSDADIVFSGGYFWGATTTGDIERIALDGTVTVFANPGLPGGAGGAYVYGNGDLGFIHNTVTTGPAVVSRVSVNNPINPTFTVVSTQTAPNDAAIDATSCFGANANMAITKQVSPTSYKPGSQITYTLTVTNNGPDPSSGYAVDDTLPIGLNNVNVVTGANTNCTLNGTSISCTGGALASGASDVITVTATVGLNFSGPLTNTATVIGNDIDSDLTDNTASVTTAQASADLQVTKTGTASAKPGDPVSYTITVHNNGPDDSSGWTVTDPLPPGLVNPATSTAGCGILNSVLTCTGGPLAAGADFVITVTGYAGQGFTSIQNTAGVTGTDPDPDTSNNQSTAAIPISPRSADLAISKAGPASVKVGDPVTYTLTVHNNGPDDSTGYTITDALPPGLLN
ncbi:DUF11 domain-containing protein, partial [Streptomyces sp. NPDC001795]|uniref:DUF11 domain-containing protein n=1 Tax=Streptomyces sp. NPDC001795 TaxID=3154525 RepID=UPI00332BCB46